MSVAGVSNSRFQPDDRESARFTEAAFLDRWQEGSERWGTRVALGHLGDRIFKLSNNPAYKPFSTFVQNRLAPPPGSVLSYGKLLGIDSEAVKIGPMQPFRSYSEFLSRAGLKVYTGKVCTNFKNCFRPHLTEPLTFKTFFGETLKRYNIHTITKPLIEGNIGTAGSALFGFGFLGWSIFRNSRYAYQNAKEREDGSILSRIKTIGSTITTFFGQAFKGIACWEAGTLGALIGRGLFCVGFWPQTLGSIVVGGLFGALTYKGLSRMIQDPVKPGRHSYRGDY